MPAPPPDPCSDPERAARTATRTDASPGPHLEPTRLPGLVGPWCQRWNHQRDSWRLSGADVFEPRRYEVARVAETEAKNFVIAHHYSASMPAARFCWGLYERDSLLGVAVLSVPVSNKVTEVVFPDLVAVHEALELGRFVLLDEVPANAESWFLARALRAAADEGVRGVVSFSDPAPRITADGTVLHRGHAGIIYQASNAVYTSRGTARTLRMFRDGKVLNGKSLQKFRDGSNGEYLYRDLVAHGARPLRPGENRLAWLDEAVAATTVARRHRGNHRFAFALGRTRAERRSVRIAIAHQQYPKTIDEPLVLD
jgi:hypothetical protein